MARYYQDEFIIGGDLVEASDSTILASQNDIPDGADDLSEALILQLSDLLPDAAGEVVLYASEDLPVNLESEVALRASGVSDAHVTASGVDVTGLHFYTFEDGVTIYSPQDILISEPVPPF